MPEQLEMTRCLHCEMPTATPRSGLCIVCFENSLTFRPVRSATYMLTPATGPDPLSPDTHQTGD